MKRILAQITSLLAVAFLISCNESPAAASLEETSEEVSSSSVSPPVVTVSSSSVSQPMETPIVEQPPVTIQALYVGEIGYVCTGFNTAAVIPGKATEAYMAMAELCGNRATMTTGAQPRTASVINNWIINDLKLSEALRVSLVNDVERYGASLRFYDAVDGYLRYIYIEPYGDGLGLAKQKI